MGECAVLGYQGWSAERQAMCCICRDHIDLGKTSKEWGRSEDIKGHAQCEWTMPKGKAVEVTRSDSGGYWLSERENKKS